MIALVAQRRLGQSKTAERAQAGWILGAMVSRIRNRRRGEGPLHQCAEESGRPGALSRRDRDASKAHARHNTEAVALCVCARMRADQLTGLPQRAPADRLVIASAIELGCPLVTEDERILTFVAEHGAAIGFTALAQPA